MFAAPRKPNNSGLVPLDRYIPRRCGSSLDLSYVKLFSSSVGESGMLANQSRSPRSKDVKKNASMTPRGSESSSILNISQNTMNCSFDITDALLTALKRKRQLPKEPEYSYDMPELRDDFFSSPFAWSNQGTIAVALDQHVYMSHLPNYRIGNQSLDVRMCMLPDDIEDGVLPITSVTWHPEGRYLALGTKQGMTFIYDNKEEVFFTNMDRQICYHEGDVEELVWISQEPYTVLYRKTVFESEDNSTKIKSIHSDKYRTKSDDKLCGLAVSINQKYLAYSGCIGNIYVIRLGEAKQSDLVIKGHTSAVKALAFCPWQPSLLASGGGCRDRKIKGHKVTNGANVFEIPPIKQVCRLVWCPATRELISGHGEGGFSVYIWSYPNMEPVGVLQVQNMGRVIGMGISPDGSTLATLTALDESLSLWQIAKESRDQSPKRSKSRANNSLRLTTSLPGSPLAACIR